MAKNKSTLRSIGKVGLLKVIAKGLAFFKTILIAKFFGAGGMTDAWYVANTIPEMLTSFLGFQDLKGATTSIFSHYSKQGKDEFDRSFSSILNLLLLLGIGVSILAVVFAGFLVRITAHDLDPALLEIATELARIVLPVVIFMGLSNYLTSILNSLEYYSVPALIQIIANFVAIILILVMYKSFGIHSVAWGIVLGWFSALIVQIPFLFVAKIKYQPFYFGQFDIIKKFALFFSPLLLPIFVSQINALAARNIGSTLRPAGKITAHSYAVLIVGSIVSMAVEPFTTVLLPKISRLVASNKFAELKVILEKYTRYFLLLMLPISIFIAFNSSKIITLIFQRGAFDDYAHHITTLALLAASTSILPWAMNLFYKIYFLSIKNTRIIATIDVITIILHIIMNFVLARFFDLFGLVFAATVAYTARYIIYGIFVDRKLDGYSFGKSLLYLLKILPAGAAMVLIIVLTNRMVNFDIGKQINSLVCLTISGTLGSAIYIILLKLLGIQELIEAKTRLFSRWRIKGK